MNKQEQLAEQIAEKHLGKKNFQYYGTLQKQGVIAAIVEAMGVQQDDLSWFENKLSDYIKMRDGWKEHTEKWETYDLVVREYNLIVKKLKESAPAKAVEAMPDEQEIRNYIIKEWWGYEDGVELSTIREGELSDIIKIVKRFAKVEAMDSLPAQKGMKWVGTQLNKDGTYSDRFEAIGNDYVASDSNTDDTSLASHSCTDNNSIEQ